MLFASAAATFPAIAGQPTDDDLTVLQDVLYPLLLDIPYDEGGLHNLIGLIEPPASYTATWHALWCHHHYMSPHLTQTCPHFQGCTLTPIHRHARHRGQQYQPARSAAAPQRRRPTPTTCNPTATGFIHDTIPIVIACRYGECQNFHMMYLLPVYLIM